MAVSQINPIANPQTQAHRNTNLATLTNRANLHVGARSELQIPNVQPQPRLNSLPRLPMELLSEILDYLPLQQVQTLRSTNKEFKQAAEQATVQKLTRKGIKRQPFKACLEAAHDFVSAADALKNKNQALLEKSEGHLSKKQLDFQYLPLSNNRFFEEDLTPILLHPALKEHCKISVGTRFGRINEMGLNLRRAGLKARVNAITHREALIKKLAEISPAQYSEETHTSLTQQLNAGIDHFRYTVNPEAESLVNYLPNITSPVSTTDTNGRGHKRDSYQIVRTALSAPLLPNYGVTLKGIGQEKGPVVGIDLTSADLALSIKPRYLPQAITATNQLIDDYVKLTKQALLNL